MPIRAERGTHTISYELPAEPLSSGGKQRPRKLIAAALAFIPNERKSLFEYSRLG